MQPDVVLAVGMLRARTVAELARAGHRWFTPHTWTNGLGLLANLHVAAGVGGGPYLEFPYDPPGWTEQRRDFFLAEPLLIDAGGCLTVPAAPGLGAQIDEDAVARWAAATEGRLRRPRSRAAAREPSASTRRGVTMRRRLLSPSPDPSS